MPVIDAGNPNAVYNDDDGSINDMGVYGGNVDSLRLITAIDNYNKNVNQLPEHFELSQNYPNPFNPSTAIEFSLPKSELTTLKVYNILGKEVSTIVSKKLNQGSHTYQFDGKNLASGIYFYRIEAGKFQDVKKMILIK